MPKYCVFAYERFLVRTTYHDVEADSADEAERACQDGDVSYDEKEICEGSDEWIETISVEEVED